MGVNLLRKSLVIRQIIRNFATQFGGLRPDASIRICDSG